MIGICVTFVTNLPDKCLCVPYPSADSEQHQARDFSRQHAFTSPVKSSDHDACNMQRFNVSSLPVQTNSFASKISLSIFDRVSVCERQQHSDFEYLLTGRVKVDRPSDITLQQSETCERAESH